MDIDRLLAELTGLTHHRPLQPGDGALIAHKFNQLNSWLCSGGVLPEAWTRQQRIHAEAQKRISEEAGC